MLTASIQSVRGVNSQVLAVVLFHDDAKGSEDFSVEYVVTSLEQLKNVVKNRIDQVSVNTKLVEELSKLIDQPLDTDVTPIIPTPDQIAEAKYFADLAVLNKMIEGIKNGIRKESDPDYLAQLDLVKSEFKPEYEK